MLTSEVIKKIENSVYTKPRSIQEIATLIKKNWRTADRYVDQIEKDFGTIATRTFRGGTRGALKIVYWASIEKVSSSIFQEKLEKEILIAKKKEDFSAFDIHQHLKKTDKKASVELTSEEEKTNLKEFAELLNQTKKQLLIFSGNLSFINLKNKDVDIFKVFEGLIKRGVTIRILSRVDLTGQENIEKILSLSYKHGKDNTEIRHCEHPLRAFIVDNKVFRIKEVKEPTGKTHELNKKMFIYYTMKDKEWIDWLSRIFWKMFSTSIDGKRRSEELKRLG